MSELDWYKDLKRKEMRRLIEFSFSMIAEHSSMLLVSWFLLLVGIKFWYVAISGNNSDILLLIALKTIVMASLFFSLLSYAWTTYCLSNNIDKGVAMLKEVMFLCRKINQMSKKNNALR